MMPRNNGGMSGFGAPWGNQHPQQHSQSASHQSQMNAFQMQQQMRSQMMQQQQHHHHQQQHGGQSQMMS
eukprot:CAMPEP_0172557044 /NCGR_PEP_ID=MMETSP1067-20121228/71125_1 /TAXON_ID=265564 ORGANISM="Thalassiosira punctigera, Strain Tpunct2005C2" /NCGR_SAMPLE_ID=MMETSP1067 /ASSEMBLY_ACC=CAM_ASM_000444 /LENGTH=68 /DNA_ID=CAMNT_0013346023 /DNA_START=28 /DNA_END=230 /DNA_ORIENTATION=-